MTGPAVGDAALRAEMEALGSALVVGALGARAPWTTSLRRVAGPPVVAAPAYTVSAAPADNLALHLAVRDAPEGALLVTATQGTADTAVWGEVLTTAALARGVAGLVTDGAVRDVRAMRELGFPVFAAATSPASPSKAAEGTAGAPVRLCGLEVCAGDWLVADDDAIVVVARGLVEETLSRARAAQRRERELLRLVRAGTSTLDALQLCGPEDQGER